MYYVLFKNHIVHCLRILQYNLKADYKQVFHMLLKIMIRCWQACNWTYQGNHLKNFENFENKCDICFLQTIWEAAILNCFINTVFFKKNSKVNSLSFGIRTAISPPVDLLFFKSWITQIEKLPNFWNCFLMFFMLG